MKKRFLIFLLFALFLFCTKVDFGEITGDFENNTNTDVTAPTIILKVDDPDFVVVNSINSYKVLAEAYDTLNDSTVVDYTAQLKIENTVDPTVIDTYYVNLSVTDSSGNSAYDTLMVIVTDSSDIPEKDTIPPVVTLLGESKVLHLKGTPYEDAGAVAVDNVDGTIDPIVEGLNTINVNDSGKIYIIIYYAIDKAGNVSDQVKRIVEIVVEVPEVPTITIDGPNPLNLKVGDSYIKPDVSAYDSTDGDISGQVVISGDTVNTNKVGTYNVIFTVTDSDGNSVSDTLIVNVTDDSVEDVTAPVITIENGNTMSIDSGATYTHPNVTATDNVDGDVSASIDTTGDVVDTKTLGTYKVIFSATDAANNKAYDTLIVTVISTSVADTIAPVITIENGNTMSVDSGATYTHPNVTATDNKDGDVSASIDTTGDVVDTKTLGSYKVIFSATDAANNKAYDTLIVTVVSVAVKDTIAPVITIENGNTMSVDSGATYTHPNVTATDNKDGDVSASIDTTGDVVDTKTLGSYKVIFSATDAANNKAYDTLIVTVVSVVVEDTIAPVITIENGNTMSVDSGATYTHPNVTATDNKDGDVSSSIDTTGDVVDTKTLGSYKVIFSATDAANNKAYDTLIVTVKSTSSPDTVTVTTSGNPLSLSKTTVYIIPSITSTKTLQIEAGAAAITVTEYDKQSTVEGPITINPNQNALFTAWGDEVIVVEPSGSTTVRFTWW